MPIWEQLLELSKISWGCPGIDLLQNVVILPEDHNTWVASAENFSPFSMDTLIERERDHLPVDNVFEDFIVVFISNIAGQKIAVDYPLLSALSPQALVAGVLVKLDEIHLWNGLLRQAAIACNTVAS